MIGAGQKALTQDDRLLAAAAHLSFLAGFWLVGPIAIYLVKRKESRFVALYALQAAVVQILFTTGAMGLGVIGMVLFAVAGVSRHEVVAVAAILPMLGAFVAGFVLLCVHASAAYSAWQGNELRLPVAGRLAQAIMRADEGAAKP